MIIICLVPYRDFFMSIAYITGGQYVPMVNAKLLAQVIIGGVREEISLERLMQDAQEDINREMKKAEAEGADEAEITTRVNSLLKTKNLRVTQMDNLAGATSSIAKERYSKCADMSELRSQYKVEAPPELVSRKRMTREAFRRSAASGGGLLDTVKGYFSGSSKEEEEAPPPSSYSAAAAPASPEMNYDLREDEAVSMAQTERIVQRMRNKK
jgi:hypothetical protein